MDAVIVKQVKIVLLHRVLRESPNQKPGCIEAICFHPRFHEMFLIVDVISVGRLKMTHKMDYVHVWCLYVHENLLHKYNCSWMDRSDRFVQERRRTLHSCPLQS